jgi:hypothetical protein
MSIKWELSLLGWLGFFWIDSVFSDFKFSRIFFDLF